MKIVRTFHPIGQGAFYSESFYNRGSNQYNVVYDCGVQHVDNSRKNVVKQAFTKEDTIDYLFISHFDEDHISLITTLIESVRNVHNVVLPYIGLKDVKTHLALSSAFGLKEVSAFWTMVSAAIEGNLDRETRFRFVVPYENEDREQQYGRLNIRSGEVLDLFDNWIYIPFNKHVERKQELEEKLEDLVKDEDFEKEIKLKGLTMESVEGLKSLMTHKTIADLLSSDKIKKSLQKVYKEISGTINQNSLLVYSGPPDTDTPYRMRDCCYGALSSKWCGPWIRTNRVACLYTGDSDLDMSGYHHDIRSLWDNVGTIQLPHHGSYGSFNYTQTKNSIDRRFIFPVSCGETNQYGHPSAKVLKFLLANDCYPVIVTEQGRTIYSQVIYG